MNSYHVISSLRGIELDADRVHGSLDAAAELILKRLENPGEVDLKAVLCVIELARETQARVCGEIFQISHDLNAESHAFPHAMEPLNGSPGGES